MSNKPDLSKNEVKYVKEKFIMDYSKKKGWNPSKLTTEQMLEIVQQREYKNPGLVLG